MDTNPQTAKGGSAELPASPGETALPAAVPGGVPSGGGGGWDPAEKRGWGWSFRMVLDAYRVSNRLIWRGGLWKYWLLPALLSLLYLPVLAMGIWWGSEWMASQMKWSGEVGSWAWWAWRVFWWGVFGMVGWFTYRSVVMVFHAPFLDAISERVEKELTGRDVVPAMTWLPMAVRSVKMAVLTGVASMGVSVVNAVVSLIPGLGLLLSLFVFLPIQWWIGGIQSMDPCLGRNGERVRRSLGRGFRRPIVTTLVGGVGSLILLIPVIGWFVGPTYLVVAGGIVAMRMRELDPR